MNRIILPGLIDPHVHLRSPNQEEKEDFHTGTCAALAGGYTTILDMPNNKTPITTSDRLGEKIKIAKDKIVCDVGFYFGSLGDDLSEFEKVKSEVFGLKLYLNQTTGNFLIDKSSLSRIFSTFDQKMPILIHAEEKAVEDVLNVLKEIKRKVHFCHISLASELKLIAKAKEKGFPVTCGVTPHHLFLNEHDDKKLGPFGRMKPPLRPRKDVDFLWRSLKDIDVIESDHAPHTLSEKQSDNPPFGVPGLETTLPLLLTAYSEKRLTLDDVTRLCYENPSKIFGIKEPNNTYIEVDLNEEHIIQNKNLFTKCGWSPFNGWRVKGKVNKVFIRGKKVFENGKILASPGFGKVISPKYSTT